MIFSRSPLVSLLGTFVSIIPAVLAGVFIFRLATPELPREFYIEQLFYGSLPGWFVSFVVREGLVAVLTDDLRNVIKNYTNLKPEELPTTLASGGGVWKEVALSLLDALLLAGCVEETLKLVVGLRTKKLSTGGASDSNSLSAHSVVVGVMGGALGFASTEHFLYTISAFSRIRSLRFAAGFSYLRAAMVFPLHCGTALIIGVALAENVVLKTGVTVWPAFLLSICIHGSYDAILMVASGLISIGVLPASPWISMSIFVVDVLIIVALLFYCRAVYSALETKVGYETIERNAFPFRGLPC